MWVVFYFQRTTTNFARTNLLIIITVNNIVRIIWELKDEIYINITVFILQLPHVWKKSLGSGNIYRLLHVIVHIISFISPRSWYQHESRQAQGMIYERGLIKGMTWKMKYYHMFIVYFNSWNNWFAPKSFS